MLGNEKSSRSDWVGALGSPPRGAGKPHVTNVIFIISVVLSKL